MNYGNTRGSLGEKPVNREDETGAATARAPDATRHLSGRSDRLYTLPEMASRRYFAGGAPGRKITLPLSGFVRDNTLWPHPIRCKAPFSSRHRSIHIERSALPRKAFEENSPERGTRRETRCTEYRHHNRQTVGLPAETLPRNPEYLGDRFRMI